MSGNSYKRAMRILERWPLDPFKGSERDFGVLLRQTIAASFQKGELSQISDPKKCDAMLTSLENLCADKHCKQYPTNPELKVGALKLYHDECQYINSDEALQEMNEDEAAGPVTWLSKLFKTRSG